MKSLCLTVILSAGLWTVACGSPPQPASTPSSGSYRAETVDFAAGGVPESLHAASVTAAFFPEARVQPLLGRAFVGEEYRSTAPKVTVLSRKLWQRKFGGDPSIIGKTVQLNGGAYTVVGIMPQGFEVPERAELWIPQTESGKQ